VLAFVLEAVKDDGVEGGSQMGRMGRLRRMCGGLDGRRQAEMEDLPARDRCRAGRQFGEGPGGEITQERELGMFGGQSERDMQFAGRAPGSV